MHPDLLNVYAIELQLERERSLLNLTVEERLIRRAKLVPISNGIKLSHINPFKILQEISKRLSPQKRTATISIRSNLSCCVSCGPLQGQVC